MTELKPKAASFWPSTLPQAVDRLLAELSDDLKEEIRSTPPHELCRYHRLPKHRHRFALARPSA